MLFFPLFTSVPEIHVRIAGICHSNFRNSSSRRSLGSSGYSRFVFCISVFSTPLFSASVSFISVFTPCDTASSGVSLHFFSKTFVFSGFLISVFVSREHFGLFFFQMLLFLCKDLSMQKNPHSHLLSFQICHISVSEKQSPVL